MTYKFISPTTIDRFWKYTDKGDENECWNWKGAIVPYKKDNRHRQESKRGYLGVGWVKGKTINEYAYRVSWKIHNGEIPKGMMVLHKCDNPLCVNPNHLYLGTAKDNARDMLARKRAKHQIYPPPPDRFVPKHRFFRKLSDSDIDNIRAQHESGNTMSEIARQFGVSLSLISRILSGQRRINNKIVLVSERRQREWDRHKARRA